MHSRFALFFLIFFLTAAPPITASDSVYLHVTIGSWFSLTLPDDINLGTAVPGENHSGSATVTVRANSDWELQVTSSAWLDGDDQPVELDSILEVGLAEGGYAPTTTSSVRVVAAGTGTEEEGEEISVDFRFAGSPTDPAGQYKIQLQFSLIPQT